MSNDFKPLTLPAKHYLSGEDGVRLRAEFNMDELDHSDTLVPILVPDVVRDVDQEFIEAFFLPTARKQVAGRLKLNIDMIGPYALQPETPIMEIKRGTNFGEFTHRVSRVLQNHIFGNDPEAMTMIMLREGIIKFDTVQKAQNQIGKAAKMGRSQLADDLHQAFFGADTESDNAAGDASHYGFRADALRPR